VAAGRNAEIMMDPNEEICVIKWTLQDLVCAFQGENIEPTEEALNAVIDHINGDLADLCIERGWEVIEDAIARKPWLATTRAWCSGCDGCCARDDFPGKLQETTLTSKNKDCLDQMLFAEIDWQLLRKQKLQLINFIEANSNNQNIEFLNGILALVDHFQDCAVDSSCASEDVVFGHLFD
jgi:hypothetical protein